MLLDTSYYAKNYACIVDAGLVYSLQVASYVYSVINIIKQILITPFIHTNLC